MSDFAQLAYQDGYPKRISVDCFCQIENQWAMQYARPAEKLCANCEKWQAWFERQYLELCEKAGIKPVDLPEQTTLQV
jgi:hypothetical protein